MAPDVRIGISGWRYEPWRGVFYPKSLPQRSELHFASRMMRSVEINGSFYSLQRPSSYLCWRHETPDDFVFAVKGGRFITHAQQEAARRGRDVFVYFDNDVKVRAPFDAMNLAARLGHGGLVAFPRKARRAVEAVRGVEEPLSTWDRWKFDPAKKRTA